MLRILSSFEFLLATGVTLCIFAVVIRGFAQAQRRANALRRQGAIADRQLDPTRRPAPLAEPASAVTPQRLRWIARTLLAVGVALCAISLLRR